MPTQITADLPTLNFPREVDYPTQEDWAAFSAAAEENFGILGGGWSTQMQLWKTEANEMSTELNTNATIAQGLANYQGDWVSQGYTLNQTVSIGEVYYICKLTHATGQNPTDVGSLYWNLALGNWSLKADKTEVALKADKDISPYSSKPTPIDSDLIPLSDSASSFEIKKLSWANLKATLLTYFDTLYSRTSKIFGIGQTWQDVTASRSAGVTYTNSTGKPIAITIIATMTGANAGIVGYVDGSQTAQSYSRTTATYQTDNILLIAPASSTYKIDSTGVSVVTVWNELR